MARKKAAKQLAAVEKYRDIDESSVARLIRAKVESESEGIAPDELKMQMLERFAKAIDANLKELKGKQAIKATAGLLIKGPDYDKFQKIVCAAYSNSNDPAKASGLSDDEVIKLVRKSSFNDSEVEDWELRDAIQELSKIGGSCLKKNDSGLYVPG